VKLWSLTSRKLLATLPGCHTPCFSPDGKVLATAATQIKGPVQVCLVQFWDVGKRKPRAAGKGHKETIAALAFAHRGKLVASAGADKTVRLWDPANGKEQVTLTGHATGVTALAFAPGADLLASGGADRTVRLWAPAKK
jgi:WD40 repeat protein